MFQIREDIAAAKVRMTSLQGRERRNSQYGIEINKIMFLQLERTTAEQGIKENSQNQLVDLSLITCIN